jgi:hypothetical protein
METIILKIDSTENAKRIAALLTLLKGVTQVNYVKDGDEVLNETSQKAIKDALAGKTTKAGKADKLLELLEK